ncbi:MAG: hypothetical protein JNK78_17565 [Planctomycetes bacterium]|nr:hypothetical protein [Planctomycetota bacterium]
MHSAHGFHIAALLLAGCAAAPAPLAERPIDLAVHHELAGPASGGAALAFSIRVLALRAAPLGSCIETAAAVIAAEELPTFRAAADLPPGTVWLAPGPATERLAQRAHGDGGPDPDAQSLGATTVVVPAGTAAVVRPSTTDLPTLRIATDATGPRLWLDTPGATDGHVQHVLLRETLPSTGSAALFVPGAGTACAGRAIVITAVEPPSVDALLAAITAARIEAAAVPPSAARERADIAAHAIGEHNLRPALLAIARQQGLAACTDALLTADESHLAAIAATIGDVDPDAPGAAWAFAQKVWSAFLPSIQRDQLTAGLRACLTRQFGSLALDASTLQQLLATSADAEAFRRSVHDENVQDLASRDAVQRVRAHEWLAAQGAAVPGYDPLGPANERRRALRPRANTASAGSETR